MTRSLSEAVDGIMGDDLWDKSVCERSKTFLRTNNAVIQKMVSFMATRYVVAGSINEHTIAVRIYAEGGKLFPLRRGHIFTRS